MGLAPAPFAGSTTPAAGVADEAFEDPAADGEDEAAADEAPDGAEDASEAEDVVGDPEDAASEATEDNVGRDPTEVIPPAEIAADETALAVSVASAELVAATEVAAESVAAALEGVVPEPSVESAGATVQALSSCTRASPSAPVTGVNVNVQVCSIGPEAVCRVFCVCTVTGWVRPPLFWRRTRLVLRDTAGLASEKPARIDDNRRHKDNDGPNIVFGAYYTGID